MHNGNSDLWRRSNFSATNNNINNNYTTTNKIKAKKAKIIWKSTDFYCSFERYLIPYLVYSKRTLFIEMELSTFAWYINKRNWMCSGVQLHHTDACVLLRWIPHIFNMYIQLHMHIYKYQHQHTNTPNTKRKRSGVAVVGSILSDIFENINFGIHWTPQ